MSATARVTEKARLPTNDVIGSSWNGVVAGDHGAVVYRICTHPPTSSQRGRQRGWGVQAGTAIATQPVEASPRPGWCREASDLAHTPSCRPPTPPQAERPPAGVPTAPPCVPPASAPPASPTPPAPHDPGRAKGPTSGSRSSTTPGTRPRHGGGGQPTGYPARLDQGPASPRGRCGSASSLIPTRPLPAATASARRDRRTGDRRLTVSLVRTVAHPGAHPGSRPGTG